MMKSLNNFAVIPLLKDHIDETCQDIKNMYDNGVISYPLMMMTLTPESDPPIDKAKKYCELYVVYRDKLASVGVPCGVLVQASVGHGYKLGKTFPFQHFIGMSNGASYDTVCPYDKGFLDYIYDALRQIAMCSPAHIMIDDDLRLIGRGTCGCGCELHVKRFNDLAKTDLSRQEIYDILISGKNPEYEKIYIETQKEAVLAAAKAMRRAIDDVDPSIGGSFCCVGNNAEFGAEISQILSGKGNPVTIRINNANYTAEGPRNLIRSFHKAASQVAKLRDTADIILAETDTCPQNRYSTGAMQLHSHFTGSLLEGTNGAKHWLNRLSAYEPASGKAYRKILAKYSGFYEFLAQIVPKIKWDGFCIPVLNKPTFRFGSNAFAEADGNNAWSDCVLSRLGLPMYYSDKSDGILCLEGDVFMSDNEIEKALCKTVILSSDSAKQLINRGYGEDIGVDVKPQSGLTPKAEIDCESNNPMSLQKNLQELVPLNDNAEILSYVCHSLDGIEYKKLFPGVVKYKNKKGGIVYTFCGTPKAAYNIHEAFSFLNYTRKQQLIKIMTDGMKSCIYMPSDEEVYFRMGELPDKTKVCTIFNIGCDPIEQTEIICTEQISKIEMLMPNGSLKKVDFVSNKNMYTLDACARTLEPVVLFVSTK